MYHNRLLIPRPVHDNRPFAFTGVTAHSRIHLLQSDFSLFIWSKQRIPTHICYRRDLENDGMVQMKCEKPLCGGWVRISTGTAVNAKGLMQPNRFTLNSNVIQRLSDSTVCDMRV